MNNFLILFLFFSFPYLNAQYANCYFLGIDLGEQYLDAGKIEEALIVFDKIENRFSPEDPLFYLKSAKCSFILNNSEEVCRKLNKSFLYGATLEDLSTYQLGGVVDYESARLNEFYASARTHLSSFNFELYDLVSNMYTADTFVRRHIMHTNDEFDYTEQVDSINYLVLKNILELNYGRLPSFREIGQLGVSKLQVVLLHLGGLENADNFSDLLEILETGLKYRTYRPIDYALLMDRRTYYRTGAGIYGTILLGDGIIPVSDISTLDETRHKIGLYSLQRQLEKNTDYSYTLPKEYKEQAVKHLDCIDY